MQPLSSMGFIRITDLARTTRWYHKIGPAAYLDRLGQDLPWSVLSYI